MNWLIRNVLGASVTKEVRGGQRRTVHEREAHADAQDGQPHDEQGARAGPTSAGLWLERVRAVKQHQDSLQERALEAAVGPATGS